MKASKILVAMGEEQRQIGIDLGRIEALREASKVLLRMLDRARDKSARHAIEEARRRIERLTIEPLTTEPLIPGVPDVPTGV